MRALQNTLYITTPNAYLSLDGENVVILNGDETLGRIPLHNLENIVSFGYRGSSPALMGACVERNIGLCFLTQHGRFLARISGAVNGNVLLRTEQYRAANSEKGLKIAQMLLTGKIYNGRWFLDRFGRDHPQRVDLTALQSAIDQMKNALDMIQNASSRDALMGIEGQAAKAYFSVFCATLLILHSRDVHAGRRLTRSTRCFPLPIRFWETSWQARWNPSALIRPQAFCTLCAPGEHRSRWIYWKSCVLPLRIGLSLRKSTWGRLQARTSIEKKTAPIF